MSEQKNPLREWRVYVANLNPYVAARKLGMSPEDYVLLEDLPNKLCIATDTILHIAEVTRIPLPVLVDWLTETTKESVS